MYQGFQQSQLQQQQAQAGQRTVRQRITKQQAIEIALKSVPGEVMHVDMDLENGVLVYEVFVLTSDGFIYEVELLAKNGRILKIEQEDDWD